MNDSEQNEAERHFMLKKAPFAVLILPPLILNEFWMNYTCIEPNLNNNLRKVTSLVHNPTVVKGTVRNILSNERESTVNWALDGSIYPG